MRLKRHMHHVYRWLVFAIMGTIILAAVGVTAVRLMLPSVDVYRVSVEGLASQFMRQPVRIGTLDARLVGLRPTLIFHNVRLLNRTGTDTIAQFNEARLGLDLINSLRRGRPVVDTLTVVGAELSVVRHKNGAFEVAGLALPKAEGKSAPVQAGGGVAAWLLSQGHIAIQHSRLLWRDEKLGIGPLDFQRVNLELYNQGDHHRLNATVLLPDGMGRSFNFFADITGDLTRPGGWDGRAYAAATDVDLGNWLRPPPLRGVTLRGGKLDFNLWSRWQAAKLVELSGEVAGRDLQFADAKQRLPIEQLGGRFDWRRRADGWGLDVGDMLLAQAGAPGNPIRLHLQQGQAGMQLLLNRADVAPLVRIAGLGELLPPALHEALARTAPAGEVSNLRVELPSAGPEHLQGTFQDLRVKAWKKYPGIDGAGGHFVWQGGKGSVVFDGSPTTVALPTMFRAPLKLDHLSGVVRLQQAPTGWQIAADRLVLGNADITLELGGRLRTARGETPMLDLQGAFRDGDATSVPRYLPTKIMHEGTVTWLDNAFRAGRVIDGTLLFHGPLSGFPFDAANGRFEVRFRAQGVALNYQPGWPPLTDVSGEVSFDGRRMQIQAQGAKVLGASIGATKVTINDLWNPVLSVDGTVSGKLPSLLALLTQSPLSEHFGAYAARLDGSGPMRMALKLGIPLNPRMAQQRPLSVDGDLALPGDTLTLRGSGVTLQQLQGQFHFTGATIQGSDLTAQMFGQPVDLFLFTDRDQDGPYTRIAGRGEAPAKAIAEAFPLPLLKRVAGPVQWQASLILPHTNKRGAELRLTSDLSGVAVNLPAPLGKPAEGKRVLNVAMMLSGPQQGRLGVDYGTDFHALFSRDEGGALRRGELRFDDKPAQLPKGRELRVHGSLDNLDLGAWAPILAQLGDQKGGKRRALPLVVEMQRLHLKPGASSAPPASEAAQRELPPMRVAIKQFGYGDYNFDRLDFTTRWIPGALRLDNLLLTAPSMHLTGNGRWNFGMGHSRTQLSLELRSDNLGQMLKGLGYAATVKNGKLQSKGELGWAGTPADFSLQRLTGKMHLRVDDGVIEEVDPGAGRLLGLFTLQALPRRLMLDFSDLFQKGMPFDYAEGDLDFHDGSMYTNNLHMSSSSATLVITGRTGLVARDYDQLVTVVPNVAGSLPVAGGLALGPQVGAVLLLLQKLFQSDIDKAAQFQYKVTGTWEKPIIKRLGGQNGK